MVDKNRYKISEENKELRNRIYNFKFISALQYTDGETEEVKGAVKLLADMFGNSGWIDAEIGSLISYVLILMGINFE